MLCLDEEGGGNGGRETDNAAVVVPGQANPRLCEGMLQPETRYVLMNSRGKWTWRQARESLTYINCAVDFLLVNCD